MHCALRILVIASILGTVSPLVGADPKAEFPLKDGDVWVMAGDSLTVQHLHSNYFEAFCFARYPKLKFAFRNAGVANDTVNSIQSRFNYDVAPWNPTVVSVELGMNDRDDTPPDKYVANMGKLIKRIRDAKARPVLLSTGPINNGDTLAELGDNKRLNEYANALKTFAANEKIPYADQFHDLIDIWGKNKPRELLANYYAGLRQMSKDNSMQGIEHLREFLAIQDKTTPRPVSLQGDPVHPGPTGQLMMAAALLRELGADGFVSSATLDSSGKVTASEGCKITAVSAEESKLEFDRLDERLPFPIPDGARGALSLYPVILELSRYTLKVTGLKPGVYTIKIDGVITATVGAKQLESGINLTAYGTVPDAEDVNPIVAQSRAILAAVAAKETLVGQWRDLSKKANAPGAAAGLMDQLRDMTKKVQEADGKIREAAQPHKMHFELTATGPMRRRVEASGPVTPSEQKTKLDGAFPNRRALVISVNNYLYMNPTLPGSTKGSASVSGLLEHLHAGLRIPSEQTALLSDTAPSNPIKLSQQAIEDALTHFLSGVREQDCLLLMFAGHVVDAAPADGQPEEACLVPFDGVPGRGETLIPLSRLLHQLELSPARQKLLILDVCRFNPARGLEFPGSGPDDSDKPGAMWEKLDRQLAEPPEGVQVWVSCLKNQFSYELEGEGNCVFLQALDSALGKLADKTQYPEEVLPLPDLVKAVNSTMQERLKKYTGGREKWVQISRLSGTYYVGGLTYDKAEEAKNPLAKLTVKEPIPKEGPAKVEDLEQMLAEMKLPPIRPNGANPTRELVPPLDVQVLPFIAADDLKDFLQPGDSTPQTYRREIDKARTALKNLPALNDELLAQTPATTDKAYDDAILARQRQVAGRQDKLEGLLKEMKATDEKDRGKASKRWRANFDLVKSHVLAELAYSYEVNSALAAARKKEMPAVDKNMQQNGWRMVATTRPQGDKEGKDAAKARLKVLQAMQEECKGTPWEIVARREEFAALGVNWQPARLEAGK